MNRMKRKKVKEKSSLLFYHFKIIIIKKTKIHFFSRRVVVLSFFMGTSIFIHLFIYFQQQRQGMGGNTREKKYYAKKKHVQVQKKKILFYRIILKFPYNIFYFWSLDFTTHYLGMDASSYKNSTEKEKLWFVILHTHTASNRNHFTHWLRVYLDKRIKIKNSPTAFESYFNFIQALWIKWNASSYQKLK